MWQQMAGLKSQGKRPLKVELISLIYYPRDAQLDIPRRTLQFYIEINIKVLHISIDCLNDYNFS
jgi:hypothetical protein